MNNETLADILADMRDPENDYITNNDLRDLADRIEAAAKHERIQREKVSFKCGDCARFGGDCDVGDSDGNEDCVACEKFVRRALVPCDAAAMREAAEKLVRYLPKFTDGPSAVTESSSARFASRRVRFTRGTSSRGRAATTQNAGPC